jgi:hypothetical protein
LTNLAGISRKEAEKQGVCTWCKQPITDFKDAASRNEYRISGFCQKCQDGTFNNDSKEHSDITYPCEYCGKEVTESEAYLVEHHIYCSGTCYGHDVGF